MTKVAFVILSLVLSNNMALASAQNSFTDKLELWLECQNQACASTYTQKELLGFDQESIAADTQKALHNVAKQQAYIWMDTILEGDYITQGETELDEVTAVYHDQDLIAYIIRYSEKAYYTGSCDYDGENEQTLEDCTAGSISETSVVSPDFQYVEVFQDNYANFED